jgi:hypothetical protein
MCIMRRGIVAVAMVLAVVALARGDAPPTKPTIEQLIEQLSNDDFKVRQAAVKAIEAMDPEVLPALRTALKANPPLEVRRQIEKMIAQFELAAVTNPKLVTLSATARPLQEVVEQLAKQSGYPITLVPDAGKEKKLHDFKFERVPLWEALDAVCASGEMVVSRDAGQKGFQLMFSDRYQPFVSRHGAFRVVGQGLQYSKSTSRSNQLTMVARKPADGDKQVNKHESETLHFTLAVEAEPRVPALGLGEVIIKEAFDDRKQSLVPQVALTEMIFGGRRSFTRVGGFPGMNMNAWVPLKPASKNAKSISLLKGTIPVQIEKETKITVLAEKALDAKGKKFKFGDVSIEIDEVKHGANQLHVYLTMTGGRAAAGEIDGELELRDDKGNAYQVGGSGLSSDGQTARVHFTYVGVQDAKSAKLVHLKRVTMEYMVPFEFRNLPLP